MPPKIPKCAFDAISRSHACSPLPAASKDLSPVTSAVRDAITSPKPLTRYYRGKVSNIPVAVLCRLCNVLPGYVCISGSTLQPGHGRRAGAHRAQSAACC